MSRRGLRLAASLALLAGCDRDPAPARPPVATPPTQAVAAVDETAAPADVKLVVPVAVPTSDVRPPPPAGPAPSATPPPNAAEGTPPGALATAGATYPPKNECAALPGFSAFRDKLVAAVRRRDPEALVALADPAVRLDFGGGAGRDELRSRLAGKRPELWGELGELLRLGCAVDAGLATLPWIFSRMPDSVDAYRALLVRGEKVTLREKPSPTAASRGELSWVLVAPVGEPTESAAPYSEVQTLDGSLRGFVETDRLRSLLDYRIIAEPQAGGWAITAFTAGD